MERRPVERRITIKTIEAVAFEHRAKRRRHREPSFGVQAQRVMRHKPVHLVPQPDEVSPACVGLTFVGLIGPLWDNVGISETPHPLRGSARSRLARGKLKESLKSILVAPRLLADSPRRGSRIATSRPNTSPLRRGNALCKSSRLACAELSIRFVRETRSPNVK